jgi:hypothetical protein
MLDSIVRTVRHGAGERTHFLLLLLAGSLLFTCSPASAKKPTVIPTVVLTGTSNAPVTGYYVVQGKRIELTGGLPLTISDPDLTQIAVRKLNSDHVLTLTACTCCGSVNQTIPTRLDEGIRVSLTDLTLASIPPQESITPIQGNTIVIAPYWAEDKWVFDDPVHGLDHEPVLKGTPDLLNELVKDMPQAREGFRLLCSTKSFKGYQKKLVWVRAEAGGNYYALADNKALKGLLRPSMFRYFSKTPKTLYLKVESKQS